VTNTGASAMTGWTVTWSFPADQRITQLWGGQHSQSGGNVAVGNASWNGGLSPGAATTFGFLVDASSAAAPPTNLACSRS